VPETVSAHSIKTFCRLCEVNCGLEATVDDAQRMVALRPDKAHPVSAGFACHKGLLALEVHRDPDRLNAPIRRAAEGEFVEASWEEAIGDIAPRLKALIEEHGPESVAVYMGNPSAFNALGAVAAGIFAQSLGIKRFFFAGTQDCTNKFAISEILYGSAEIHPIADLDHSDYILMMGTNPRISKMSFLSTPDPVGALRAARDRGAKIRFVNPLAIDDLSDVGDTLQIRPDTDAYFLAALLCEIDATCGFNEKVLADIGNGTSVGHVDRLRDFVRAYPVDRVAGLVGLPAQTIREVAREFASAESASIHISTGVNMGQQGALAYWLVQMLSLVTGNLDRRGGNIVAARAFPGLPMGEEPALEETKWGTYRPSRGATPPGSLIADMIRDDEKPIRALLVIAGNPLLSIGGEERMREAFADLDLLVSIDFYRNATAELADWVLPAADWFEREDLNFFVQGVQRKPYLQWTDRVVAPTYERKEDWWILSRIQQEMGLPSLFDLPGDDALMTLWNGRLEENGYSIPALREAEGGVVLIHEAPQGHFLERVSAAAAAAAAAGGVVVDGDGDGDGGFDCCPDAMLATMERASAIFDRLERETATQLKLITRRTHHMLNSALQNMKVLKTEAGSRKNPLFMNPGDAASRNLEEGQHVRIRNDHGELIAELALDPHLREGVVAMSHGFGNDRTPGMPVAQAHPGVNVNRLSPSGAGSFDPVSGMEHLTGIAVEVLAS
jgi:anaerobic selenocysteine-containing dehydrogenase